MFACKHRLNHNYYFTYTEKNLEHTFEKWQFVNCRANTRIYLRTFNDKERDLYVKTKKHPEGQVVKIQYDAGRECPWRGKVKLHRWYEVINLTPVWVYANFHGFAIEQWSVSPGIWHMINPGRARNLDQESSPIVHLASLPIKYQQDNLRTCMVGSFASCLHYMGMKEAAGILINRIGELYLTNSVINVFQKIIVDATKKEYSIIRKKNFDFNQAEELFNMPTLVILTGNDAKTDHAITVYKDMIFDSSHNSILKRCQKTLDWCCGDTGFHKIDRAYTLWKVEVMSKKQKIN